MKFFKWKIFIITAIVCLLPILLGLALWDRLPDTIAIHFDMNNNPDNFASKGFAVFGMPALMVLLQAFCCFVNDINAHKHGDRKKLELVTKWIIPVMTIILQAVTLSYALGAGLDIRRIVAVIVGVIMIVTGNYTPKLDYVKNRDIDTEKARRINRFIGIMSVIAGIIFIISIFFKPIATVIALLLLIPYAVICIIYGIKVGRGQ